MAMSEAQVGTDVCSSNLGFETGPCSCAHVSYLVDAGYCCRGSTCSRGVDAATHKVLIAGSLHGL